MPTLLVGYYGFSNAGDEHLLKKTLSLLNSLEKNSKITTLLPSNRKKIWGLISTIYTCDRVVLGGGSLLQTRTSKKSLYYYLFILGLAIFLKKPCYGLGIGVGPIDDPVSRWLTNRVLSRFESISFRDDLSFTEFSAFPQRALLGSDLLFYKFKPFKPAYNSNGPVGVSLNTNIETEENINDINDLLNDSFPWVGIAAHLGVDDVMLNSVDVKGEYLEDLLEGRYDDNVVYSCIISSRYHTCLWAAAAGVPFISIGLDPKCVSLSILFGQEHRFSITEEIIDDIEHVCSQADKYIRALKKGVDTAILRSKVHASVLNPTLSIFGFDVSTMPLSSVLHTLKKESEQQKLTRLITLNPQMIMDCEKDKQLNDWVKKANLIVADGQGVVMASKLIWKKDISPVTGIDLVEGVCELGGKVFLIGASKEGISLSVDSLKTRYQDLEVCGYSTGYLTPEQEFEVIEKIKESQPTFIFVGMGFPRQEYFIQELERAGVIGVVIGVGGVFDVFSGQFSRAPSWVRSLRCEWLYRGAKQPERILKWGFLPKYLYKLGKHLIEK
ncbi:hypothetical protein DID80_04055 [Candidatus Marinamargulisbacteria bacterium SCGC AAA071-K20]|nr:hypothetical protein DID80_04055 [Candidatus Marinamargulisbacteria bacterium SCGC AAA071-K20]